MGTIAALVGEGDTVFSDALNHASIIDGCRLSRARVEVYPHLDTGSLRRMVSQSRGGGKKLIVTDTVFSMDGDLTDLEEICSISERHGCMLMVDEAHAMGVLGKKGSGATEHFGVEDRGFPWSWALFQKPSGPWEDTLLAAEASLTSYETG